MISHFEINVKLFFHFFACPSLAARHKRRDGAEDLAVFAILGQIR
ncbi:hypothetical protein B4168_2510 [Anoxybacillus flavithermus]|nr:hypothetical protein B4168_2510 [Anoxybacillus flavithermus]OAO85270.1 hypothetical protein GT23_2961 [Parageobacillus thermoglucosidasius]